MLVYCNLRLQTGVLDDQSLSYAQRKLFQNVNGVIHEDNTTAIQAIKSGKNQTMWFLPRSNGVSVQVLHENLNGKKTEVPYEVEYTDTTLMVSDIHTKGFTDEKKWKHAQAMAGIMESGALKERMIWQMKYFGIKEKIPKEDNCTPCLHGELA